MLKSSGRIAMKFDVHINGPKGTKPIDFIDPMSFPLAPPSGHAYLEK